MCEFKSLLYFRFLRFWLHLVAPIEQTLLRQYVTRDAMRNMNLYFDPRSVTDGRLDQFKPNFHLPEASSQGNGLTVLTTVLFSKSWRWFVIKCGTQFLPLRILLHLTKSTATVRWTGLLPAKQRGSCTSGNQNKNTENPPTRIDMGT